MRGAAAGLLVMTMAGCGSSGSERGDPEAVTIVPVSAVTWLVGTWSGSYDSALCDGTITVSFAQDGTKIGGLFVVDCQQLGGLGGEGAATLLEITDADTLSYHIQQTVGGCDGSYTAKLERDDDTLSLASTGTVIDGCLEPLFGQTDIPITWSLQKISDELLVVREEVIPAPTCDGGVLDEVTGLCWQSPTAGGAWSDDAAIEYCATLDLGGHTTWRMPALRELMDILGDCDVDAPRGPRQCNPCAESDRCKRLFDEDWGYYASHWAVDESEETWVVDIADGDLYPSTSALHGLRCVREQE